MIIEESDFRLIPNNNYYDLEFLYIVNKGKEKEKTEFRNAAYGCTLESAIKRIVTYRIQNKYQDTVIDMKTYLNAFREELKEIKKLCQLS